MHTDFVALRRRCRQRLGRGEAGEAAADTVAGSKHDEAKSGASGLVGAQGGRNDGCGVRDGSHDTGAAGVLASRSSSAVAFYQSLQSTTGASSAGTLSASAGGRAGAGWQCGGCSYQNTTYTTRCEVCSTAKAAPLPMQRPLLPSPMPTAPAPEQHHEPQPQSDATVLLVHSVLLDMGFVAVCEHLEQKACSGGELPLHWNRNKDCYNLRYHHLKEFPGRLILVKCVPMLEYLLVNAKLMGDGGASLTTKVVLGIDRASLSLHLRRHVAEPLAARVRQLQEEAVPAQALRELVAALLSTKAVGGAAIIGDESHPHALLASAVHAMMVLEGFVASDCRKGGSADSSESFVEAARAPWSGARQAYVVPLPVWFICESATLEC